MQKLSNFDITQLWYLYGCVSRSKEALMQAKNIVLSIDPNEGPAFTDVYNLLVEMHQEDLEFNQESLDMFLSEFDLDLTALIEGIP